MDRRSFLIRTGVIAGAVGGGWWLKDHVLWRAPGVAFAADGRTPWMPYVSRVLSPTVSLRLAGREVTALVDSGAQYSVIDKTFHEAIAADLGPRPLFDVPLVAYGVGGQPQMGQGVRLDVAMEGLSLTGLRCAILDLGPLADDRGLSAPLILGQDVLKLMQLELDLNDRRLRLHAAGQVAPAGQWTRLPVRRRGTSLVAPVQVEGHPLEAVVDTGATSILSLSGKAAEDAGLRDGRTVTAGDSLVLGGSVRADVVQVDHLAAAGQTFTNVPVPIYGAVGLPGLPTALLGMQAFRDQGLLVDVGGGALYRAAQLDLTVVQ